MDKIIKNPKILGAVAIGFLAPKVTSYLYNVISTAIYERQTKKKIYVGI